jgi:hypothetical protein
MNKTDLQDLCAAVSMSKSDLQGSCAAVIRSKSDLQGSGAGVSMSKTDLQGSCTALQPDEACSLHSVCCFVFRCLYCMFRTLSFVICYFSGLLHFVRNDGLPQLFSTLNYSTKSMHQVFLAICLFRRHCRML